MSPGLKALRGDQLEMQLKERINQAAVSVIVLGDHERFLELKVVLGVMQAQSDYIAELERELGEYGWFPDDAGAPMGVETPEFHAWRAVAIARGKKAAAQTAESEGHDVHAT